MSAQGGSLLIEAREGTSPPLFHLHWAGRHTASIHIQLQDGVDAHCERARTAGAVIQREPATQPYGDRVYTCLDLEGHSWSVGQTVEDLTPQQMATATGREIKDRL